MSDTEVIMEYSVELESGRTVGFNCPSAQDLLLYRVKAQRHVDDMEANINNAIKIIIKYSDLTPADIKRLSFADLATLIHEIVLDFLQVEQEMRS